MNKDEILAMDPGSNLDAEIALKVMGFKEVVSIGDHHFTNPIDMLLKKYSTDISAAWEVVKKLREDHWCIALNSDGEIWNALFYWDPHKQTFECEAYEAPEAICKAALLAVLEEEEA